MDRATASSTVAAATAGPSATSPAERTLDLVFRGRAVLPDGIRSVAVGVQDGRIAVVAEPGAPLAAATEVLLADDEVLLPGIVDTHVHVNEPGRTEWEGFASATAAAAAGGVTTIVDMPLNSIPPTVDRGALQVKRARAAATACGRWLVSASASSWAVGSSSTTRHPIAFQNARARSRRCCGAFSTNGRYPAKSRGRKDCWPPCAMAC